MSHSYNGQATMFEQPVADEQVDGVRPPAGTDSKRRFVAIALLLLLAALGVAWWLLTDRLAREVVVEGLTVDCSRGEVEQVAVDRDGLATDDSFEATAVVPSVELIEGLDCRLQVTLRNDGAWPVTLTRVVLPFFGETSAMGPLATSLVGLQAEPVPAEAGMGVPVPARDAAWGLTRTVDPGGEVSFAVLFELSSNACMLEGASTTLGGIPEVSLRMLGRTIHQRPTPADRSGPHTAVRFVGTAHSSCDVGDPQPEPPTPPTPNERASAG